MDEQIRDGWAAASIRLRSDHIDDLPLSAALRDAGRRGRNPRLMTFAFDNPDEVRLENLLGRVTNFLRTHERDLTGLAGASMDLFLGWAPKSPQESLNMDAELIALLGRLNASVVFDTYSE